MTKGLDNLEIYQLAEELEIKVYEVTKNFPIEEKYRSVDQLRRSSSSTSDNIAEGYSRFSFNDKINKFYIARGEAEETKRGLIKAYKKGFISEQTAKELIEKYTVLIKGINGYIKFLRYQREKNQPQSPSTQVPKYPSTQSTSLILVILIISALLTAGLAVSDLIIRHSQTIKGTELSEMAYFAAESAIEKVLYKVFKEGCVITNCGVSGYLWSDGPYYKIDNADIVVGTVSDSWLATVPAGRSFQLNLDLNGASYPSSITISKSGSNSSDLIVWWCETTGTTNKVCGSTTGQTFYPNFSSQTISNINVPNKYYKIRINNRGAGSETYTFSFTGASLPIDLEINEALGRYRGYTRKIKSTSPHFPRYQAFMPE